VTWLIVILGLGLLIFLHELGHFPVARLVGMKPRAFYIGFGPALVKVRREGIEYAAIPLGGYVRIPGMQRPAAPDFETAMSPGLREDPALGSVAEAVQQPLVGGDFEAARAAVPALSTALEQAQLTPAARRPAEQAVRDVDERSGADAYWRQPTWKRLAAIAAGPGMNVLVAFVIFFAVYATGAPSQNPSTEVAQVQANTPAAAAGPSGRPHRRGRRPLDAHLLPGLEVVGGSHGRPITVTVERGGRTVTLGPRRTVEEHGRWVWGFSPGPQLVSRPLGASARLAIGDCWRVVTGTMASLRDLVHRHGGAEVSGPVGIVRTSAILFAVTEAVTYGVVSRTCGHETCR
jgi:regulator of sigma E protease